MTFRLWLATVAALICGSQADAQNKVRTETIRPSVTANPAGKPNAHATPSDAHNAAGVPDIVTDLSQLPAPVARTRERILAHQEQPQCASCHRKIDPIGFGLENFNAVGKWRAADRYEKRGVGKKEWPIDPSGAFHKGPAFKDFFELRDIIASRPEAFSRGLSEALVEYALGRPYGFSDQPLADDMVRQAAGKNFALREFIHALVQSESFHAR
mgnify:CR=1 FL=1